MPDRSADASVFGSSWWTLCRHGSHLRHPSRRSRAGHAAVTCSVYNKSGMKKFVTNQVALGWDAALKPAPGLCGIKTGIRHVARLETIDQLLVPGIDEPYQGPFRALFSGRSEGSRGCVLVAEETPCYAEGAPNVMGTTTDRGESKLFSSILSRQVRWRGLSSETLEEARGRIERCFWVWTEYTSRTINAIEPIGDRSPDAAN